MGVDFERGDRVMVVDDEPVHLADHWIMYRGAKATIEDVNGVSGGPIESRYLWLVFDGVPRRHVVPAYRFRKLDTIELLAELA